MTIKPTNAGTLRALQMLTLANIFWGLSFPTMKALDSLHRQNFLESGSLFTASSTLTIRFALSALFLLAIGARTLPKITRLEWREGLGLGWLTGIGLVFQMDGLAHTSASTSAFLTQFYCLLIPILIACREKRWPSATVIISSLLVITGVAILSGFNWQELRLGRGEIETLIASCFFAAQILWLQRPIFAGNRVSHFTLIMFAMIALTTLPVALLTGRNQQAGWTGYASGPVLICLGILTAFSSLGAYLLMNRWQPHLSATQAGVIYCLEPVFASFFALFLPGWFSAQFAIAYPNEALTGRLLLGGTLITAANILLQWPGPTAGADATAAESERG